MEKIGICTFYNNNNYGSYLQTFALEAVIGSMGYNAYLIDAEFNLQMQQNSD